MEGSSSCSGVVPDWVMESVRSSMGHLEQVAADLPQFLALCSDPEVLAQMPPIQRAQSLLLLSNLTTTLFTGTSLFLFSFIFHLKFKWLLTAFDDFPVRLRCSGVYDDDHRVNTELVCFLICFLLCVWAS